MAIKPLEDRVVIKIEQAEQTTASGLVIPETAKEKPQEARVVAVGPGRVDEKGNRIPVDIKEGDVVVFSRYGGTEVKYPGRRVPDSLRTRRSGNRRLILSDAHAPYRSSGTAHELSSAPSEFFLSVTH